MRLPSPLLLLLLFLLCKVTSSWSSGPPHIGVDELILQQDSNFNLTCEGSKPLHWKTKFDLSDSAYEVINTTGNTRNRTGYPYGSILKVDNSLYLDTGYYYCYYDGATDFESDKENVDSTYVYVYDPKGNDPFVEKSLPKLNVKLSDTLVIDCATTNPNITVTLQHGGRDITNDSRVRFNPRKGFSIEYVKVSDSGTYTCIAEGARKSMLKKTVTFGSAEKMMRQPSMNAGKNQHFVKGDSFSLECTVIDQNVKPMFSWTYPNSEAVYHHEPGLVTRDNITHYKSILKVPKASEADSGKYTCRISSPGKISNNISMQIEIKESMDSFISINDSITTLINISEGEQAEWKADMLYHPHNITIEYTDWRGQKLKPSERLTIVYKASEAQSWLKIKNVTSSDFGSYNITVTTSDGAARDSATVQLQVQSVPYMKVKGVPPFVAPKQSLNITCSAEGFPIANVSILFQECSNGRDSCNTTFNTIQREEDEAVILPPGNIVEKSFILSPTTSGLLWCHGQNNDDKQNKTADVIISEINGIFVLRHKGRKITEVGSHEEFITVVENDDFMLMCGGSKFYYKIAKLMCKSPSNSSVNFNPGGSDFSWLTEIHQKANKTLAGEYTCTAEPHGNEQNHTKRITITVSDEQRVHFAEGSNMTNETVEVTDSESVILNCNVTGDPTPTIHWMKDEEILNRTSEFFDGRSMKFLSGSKVLKFDFVTKNHLGVYTCTAKNRLNSITGSLTLTLPVPGLKTEAKAGLVTAFVGIAFLAMMVGFLSIRVKKEKKLRKSVRATKDILCMEGNIDQLNPKFTTDQQAMLLPYAQKWEIPRSNINIGKLLGSGAFGRVVKATVTGLEGSSTTTVAIKMCKSEADLTQVHTLIVELKIMIYLGKHLNIVNLIGANTEHIDTGELWIVVEYCRFGNLLDFMKRHRRKFINQVDPTTGKINYDKITMNSSPPVSPSFRDHPQTPVDKNGYLTPSSSKFVLSDPPPGHSTRSVHSSVMSSDDCSVSGNSFPQGPVGQCANNPMYSMGLGTSTGSSQEGIEGEKGCRSSQEGSEGKKGCSVPQPSQHRDCRLLSIGSNTFSDTTSVSCPPPPASTETPGSTETSDITAHMQPSSTSSPLSPTASCFMGNDEWDIKRKVFACESVPGGSAPFSTSDLISWGWQVANGMEYLSRRNVLHGDLAARNLLLADNNVVKISDFGMSRDMYKKDIYVKKRDALMPVKWMSVEAIRDRIFSVQSDVWAFGITLWEIFSLGSTPYPDIELNENFLERLQNNYRMHSPKYANQEIYDIMMQCWEAKPKARPSFSQLVDYLGLMMPQHLTMEYLSMNDTYMKINEERFKEETDYLVMMASPNFESMTKAEEADLDQTETSSSLRIQLPDNVAYTQGDNLASPSLTSSPVESDYLPMNSGESQSPSLDVFSPSASKHSRFTFTSSNQDNLKLTSFPEEDEDTAFLEPEGSFESCAFTSLRAQPPSDDKKDVDRNYMNI